MTTHVIMLGFSIAYLILGLTCPAGSLQRHSSFIQGTCWLVGVNVITVLR